MKRIETTVEDQAPSFLGADMAYVSILFLVAAVALAYGIWLNGGLLPDHDWRAAAFFFAFGLFTISVGFPHPQFGHISFDRVGHVACILIFGPVDAAWINGLASLIYPWHRLWKGVPLRNVVLASLNNFGLMTLVILISGTAYQTLGGAIPLLDLQLGGRGLALLILLMISMQILNDIGMMAVIYLRDRNLAKFFSFFSTAVELTAALIAVLIAVSFNRSELVFFGLQLAVLSLGMIVLKQLADMRLRLEALVRKRTRALEEKTLELERQATHDKLTGLYNRRYADDYLGAEIENARRYALPFSVALADIDFFKNINDRFSHPVGDAVLRRVAKTFAERCRRTDMIARYGGEEFLLCFPRTDAEEACLICEDLRKAFAEDNWSDIAPTVQVTLSFGVAQWQKTLTYAQLVGLADKRLYQAKNSGRNRIVA